MKRIATAVWNGTGKDGKGHLTTQSTVLNKTQYSFSSRFEEGIGTNPEELKTDCEIVFEDGSIVASNLNLTASVPGIDTAKFEELVRDAEANCPISKLLNTKISVTFSLNQ